MSELEEVESAPAQQRRIVLHPRTASARRLDRSRTGGGEVRGYTTDTAEVMAYMRRHRRLALSTFLPMVGLVSLLVIATAVWQGLGEIQLGRIPVLWLILGPIALFSILIVAVFHERRALRLESDWMDERS